MKERLIRACVCGYAMTEIQLTVAGEVAKEEIAGYCLHCGIAYPPRIYQGGNEKTYCSDKCARRAYETRYRQRHPEMETKYKKAWYERNKERLKEERRLKSVARKCITCGGSMPFGERRRLYCSNKCERVAYDKRTKKPYCKVCGKKRPQNRTMYCSHKCQLQNARKRAKQLKHNALSKLANGGSVECVLCGCPYEEGLSIGHFNGDGAKHRREIGKHSSLMHKWILKTPLEEVLAHVQIECIYCNLVQYFTDEYPPHRRPKWK